MHFHFELAVIGVLACGAIAAAQTTTLVSVTATGNVANDASFYPSMSSDAKLVAFHSYASDVVPPDNNLRSDIFVRDRTASLTQRVTLGQGGALGNNFSYLPVISSDGRFIAYQSLASNLVAGDTNGRSDIFLFDRATSLTTLISVSSAGVQASQDCERAGLSTDGRWVVFESAAPNLVVGDVNGLSDVFLRDTASNLTILVSRTPSGAPGNLASRRPSIDESGRWIVFESRASNLIAGDTNGVADIFMYDVLTSTTERVSVGDLGQQSNAACVAAWISGDGRTVSFETTASNLVPGDTNGFSDVFVRDLAADTTTRVSVSSSGVQGDNPSGADCCWAVTSSPLSRDGRTVLFLSAASTLQPGDTDGTWDAFVHDRLTGETARVSVGTSGQEGYGPCLALALSADGRQAAFCTADPSLYPGDNNGFTDVFLRDLGPASPHSYCSGDGSIGPCPCGNVGLPGHGCENSRSTGGAQLTTMGTSSLSSDSFHVLLAGIGPNALAVLLQGSGVESPTPFGDGLLCLGGVIQRLYARAAIGGSADFPGPNGVPVSARSTGLGAPIPMGATRHYQAYYRDGSATFCPAGGTANASNALGVLWSP